jgi:hypothetical protein
MDRVKLELNEIRMPRSHRRIAFVIIIAVVAVAGYLLVEGITHVRHAAWQSQDL